MQAFESALFAIRKYGSAPCRFELRNAQMLIKLITLFPFTSDQRRKIKNEFSLISMKFKIMIE